MTHVNASDFNDRGEHVAPSAPKQFVAFPVTAPLALPKVGEQPEQGNYVEQNYHDWFARKAASFADTQTCLWFEVEEIPFEGVEVQRDGSIALHFDDSPEVEVIPLPLAAFVRVFTDGQSANAYAQAQNGLLGHLHHIWIDAAQKMKLQAEAQIGRVVVQAAPKQESVVPQLFAGATDISAADAPTNARETPWSVLLPGTAETSRLTDREYAGRAWQLLNACASYIEGTYPMPESFTRSVLPDAKAYGNPKVIAGFPVSRL